MVGTGVGAGVCVYVAVGKAVAEGFRVSVAIGVSVMAGSAVLTGADVSAGADVNAAVGTVFCMPPVRDRRILGSRKKNTSAPQNKNRAGVR